MARILIVDDSIVMRRNLRSLLEEAGHTIVGESIDGQQAYFDYRRTKPDLVTMDITMPKVDGIDALKNIIDNFPSANIIMISALDQKAKVFSALRNGAKHYIIKPVTADKIIAVIDKVMKDHVEKELIIRNKKAEDVTKPPFIIENINNVFRVTIAKNMDYDDITELINLMQGFLMIDNINIHFDFRTFLITGEEALTKFDALVHKIKLKEGDFQIRTKSIDFVNTLLAKDKSLDSIKSDGIYLIK